MMTYFDVILMFDFPLLKFSETLTNIINGFILDSICDFIDILCILVLNTHRKN